MEYAWQSNAPLHCLYSIHEARPMVGQAIWKAPGA